MAEENAGGCPVRIRPPVEGGSNRDWWPDQINLKMLVKYPSENNPMDPDFDYAAAVAKLLKPGGRLLAIFYLDPDHDSGGPPYGCSLNELDERFSPRFRMIEEERDIPTFPGREGREILRVFERTQSI
jgi:hypothetical protein